MTMQGKKVPKYLQKVIKTASVDHSFCELAKKLKLNWQTVRKYAKGKNEK